jgi:hypothetical protein
MTVPVKLSNFGGNEAWVWCELRDVSGKGLNATYHPVQVQSGAFVSDVVVEVNYTSAQEALIAGWRCALTSPSGAAMSTGSGKPIYTAIPNLQVFGEISGKF